MYVCMYIYIYIYMRAGGDNLSPYLFFQRTSATASQNQWQPLQFGSIHRLHSFVLQLFRKTRFILEFSTGCETSFKPYVFYGVSSSMHFEHVLPNHWYSNIFKMCLDQFCHFFRGPARNSFPQILCTYVS